MLLAVGGIGVVIAAIAGGMVARTGLRPVGRLTEAAERVARTDDLRPIPVFGSDELARLTEAFNMMLRALAESRDRQARLVADAGHELRTPLTSLRTNVELLMASSSPGHHGSRRARWLGVALPTSSARSRNCRLWSAIWWI